MPMNTMLDDEASAVGRHERAVGRRRARPVAEAVARDQDLRDDLGRGAGCARAAACRCGRRSRSACSRPGSRRRACRGRPPGCRRSRSRRPCRAARSSGIRSSHLRVPSFETCSRRRPPGASSVKASASACAQALADVRHRVEVARAAQIDPVPELADAHPQLALGHADARRAWLSSSSRVRPASDGLPAAAPAGA